MSQITRSARAPSRNLRDGLRILEWLSRRPSGAGVREAAAALGLPSSSTHRFLDTLRAAGWVQQTEERRYVLGPAAARLGIAALDRLDLGAAARSALHALAAHTGETAYLGVRSGDQVAYLDIVSGRHPIGLNRRPGWTMGAHCTAVGKVILADLPPAALRAVLPRRLPRAGPRTTTSIAALRRELAVVRTSGIATNDEESGLGVYGLAAPLRDRHGRVVAGLGLGGPRERMLPRREEWSALVRRQAAAVSAALGYREKTSPAARASRLPRSRS